MKNKLTYIFVILRVSTFFANFHFWVNYSFIKEIIKKWEVKA